MLIKRNFRILRTISPILTAYQQREAKAAITNQNIVSILVIVAIPSFGGKQEDYIFCVTEELDRRRSLASSIHLFDANIESGVPSMLESKTFSLHFAVRARTNLENGFISCCHARSRRVGKFCSTLTLDIDLHNDNTFLVRKTGRSYSS